MRVVSEEVRKAILFSYLGLAIAKKKKEKKIQELLLI